MEQLPNTKHNRQCQRQLRESKFYSKKENASIVLSKFFFFSSVHLKQEEKLILRCGRDGGLESFEVHGMIMLHVKSEQYGRVLVAVDNKETRNVQLQVNILFLCVSFL